MMAKFSSLLLFSLFFLFSISTWSSLSQASCCNYPTLWKITNHTESNLYLQCEIQAQNEYDKIEMQTPVRVPSHSSYTYQWSNWHYNDGMGLRAGYWTCAADSQGNPLKNSQTAKSTIRVDEWGDNINLQLIQMGNGVKVQR